MFSDKTFEAVGFPSQAETEKSYTATNIQTEVIVYKGDETQTTETKNAQTQTVLEAKQKPQIDYESLAKFLSRVTPGVLEMLDEAQASSAFDDFDLSTSDEPDTVLQLVTNFNSLDNVDFKAKISDITWSTGGRTLAVSHSATYHETWCSHITKINFYDLLRENEISSSPSKCLEVNSCVTSLLYHPDEPSIIGAGLNNGEVLVWNLRDEFSVTPLQVLTHFYPVAQIEWHLKVFNDTSALISASTDGCIAVHKLFNNFTMASPHKSYKVVKERNARPRSAGSSRERATEPGLAITSFDFSSKDHNLFVVGTLCGGLYKCRLDQTTPIDEYTSTIDPVVDEYDRHNGSVTCVKCSSTHNIFVTSGTDKEIRIYDFEQASSLKTIITEGTVVRITWFFGNPNLFAAYGAGPEIRFFNVNTGVASEKVLLTSESRENTSCACFNPKRELVGIGDTRGNLEIWKMPRRVIM